LGQDVKMSLDWRVQNYLETLVEQFMEEGLSEKEAEEKAMERLDQSQYDYK
tara:strand:- start:770 stop:922 length:153 start_codon:yes stop_codon:yes gene_type:complete